MKNEGKARIKKGTPKLKLAVYILKTLLERPRQSSQLLAKTLETHSALP